MLQAALHLETGLQQQQHLTDNNLLAASVSDNRTHARLTNAEQDSVVVCKEFSDTRRVQCSDNVTSVSKSTDSVTANPSTAFCLSQDDFDDDMDDLSFIDLPLYFESSHSVKSSAASSQQAAVLVPSGPRKKISPVFVDVISKSSRSQLPHNCIMNRRDVIDVESAQSEQSSFATTVDFAARNGI